MKLTPQAQRAILISILCAVTFFCFRNTLNNQFTNWDDDYYVTNDPYIRSFSLQNLKVIFTQDITKNNYHPLCMFSLAVNYHFAGLTPWSYYLTNVLIHILNAVLVFLLFGGICKRLNTGHRGALFVSFFGALWFAVHPVHVESVAWIAERKDVLYTCFYLAGLLSYLQYADSPSQKWYVVTFGLFVLSCLSKPMAVVFPLSLLCFDLLLRKGQARKLVMEKVPFFLFSLLIGLAAFYTQSRTGAVASFGTLTIAERVMYASYGFVMYIAKVFNPTYLSTFYPYPYRYISGYLPAIYYAAPFIALAVLILPTWLLYRAKSPFFRIYAFGMGFFFVNVMFVLQFVSVGAAIMADRYSYVAYIGLFFLLAYLVKAFVEKRVTLWMPVMVVLLVLSGALGALCNERTKVWHNSESLLTDAIEKYPYRALLSYKWRGNYYFSTGELDKAMKDYGLLASINAADDKVKANMERIQALQALGNQHAVATTSTTPQATADCKVYVDSAVVLLRQNDTLGAFRSYIAAFRVSPVQAEKLLAQCSYNDVQEQHFSQAVKQYDMLMKISTTNPYYYFLRGCAHFGLSHFDAAIGDWETAAKMDSKEVQQSAAYNLSVVYDSIGKPQQAWERLMEAKGLGYKPAADYLNKLKKRAGK